MDIYKTPGSNLDLEKIGPPPKLAYILLLLFLLEAIFVIVINLAGSYGNEPIQLLGIEMAIVIVASIFLISYVWQTIKQGLKAISIVIYVFLAVSLIFDSSNWFSAGVLLGVAEALTLVNFLLLLSALYVVKFPLRGWFIR